MFYYRAYEQVILSNTPLSIPPVRTQSPDYTVVVKRESPVDLNISWLHDYERDSDYPWHRLGIVGAEYLVRFSGCADFIIDEKRGLITCFAAPATGNHTIEHLLLDQILPRLLDRKMLAALHAGAVVHRNGVVGLVGKTGTGKSTLTGYLGRQGYPVLTDDCLVLQHEQGRIFGLPSYPAVRLNSDSAKMLADGNQELPPVADYSEKVRMEPDRGHYAPHTESAPLYALLILTVSDRQGAGNNVRVKQCSMREAFGLLIEHTFRLDPTDKERISREFDNLNLLVSEVPVFSLAYARRYSLLDEVGRAMFEKIAEMT